MPQIMARSRHIILRHKSKWNDQQRIRAGILFEKFPDLEKAYGLFLKLVDIFNKKTSAGVARLNLADGTMKWRLSGIMSLTRYWRLSKITTLQ